MSGQVFEPRPSLFTFQPHFYLGGPTRFHLPLAYDLIAQTRPRLVVTLGFGDGEVHFTFCQAARENGSTCRLVTMRAPSSGERDDDNAWLAGISYNQECYDDISTFVEKTPETACESISDATVDVLFLNDCDSGAGLRRQFEAWFPKLSANSIILVHGIETERKDAISNFWKEMRSETSREFSAGAGLGITSLKSAPSPELARLLGKGEEGNDIERMYRLAAERIAAQAEAAKIANENRLLQLRQVWLPTLLDDRVQMQGTIDHLNRHIAHITRVHEWEEGQLRERLKILEAETGQPDARASQLTRDRDELEARSSESTELSRSRSFSEKIIREIRRIPRNLGRVFTVDNPKKKLKSL